MLPKRKGPSKQTEALVRCSFCGKSQTEVQQLIAGPGVNICDGCVHLCQDILEEGLRESDEVVLDEAPTDWERL